LVIFLSIQIVLHPGAYRKPRKIIHEFGTET